MKSEKYFFDKVLKGIVSLNLFLAGNLLCQGDKNTYKTEETISVDL